MPTSQNSLSLGRTSTDEPRWIARPWMRAEFVVSATVVGLAIVGLVALAFAYWHAHDASERARSLEAMDQRQAQLVEAIHALKSQTDIVRDQNQWSIEDRQGLHQSQAEIREALKRLEARK